MHTAHPSVSSEVASASVVSSLSASTDLIQATGVGTSQIAEIKVSADAHIPQSYDWFTLFNQLPCQGLLRQIASHCQFVSAQQENINLRLDVTQSSLYSDRLRADLEVMLSAHLQQNINLKIEIAALDGETPYVRQQRILSECHAENVAQFNSDARIRSIIEVFAGRLDERSIRVLHNIDET